MTYKYQLGSQCKEFFSHRHTFQLMCEFQMSPGFNSDVSHHVRRLLSDKK